MCKYKQFAHKILLYILLSTLIVSCAEKDVTTQWTDELQANNVSSAMRITDTTQFVTWESETKKLSQIHGGIKGMSFNDIVPPTPNGSPKITRVKFFWRDGSESCLRIRITQDNKVQPLDPVYQPCN
jgi:hypothetical protein